MWDNLSQPGWYRLFLDAPMARFGSASTALRVGVVLFGLIVCVGCGGSTSGAESPDGKQGAEMTKESGFGGEEFEEADDVEPADHDVEVPPAP